MATQTITFPQQIRNAGHLVSTSRTVPVGALNKSVDLDALMDAADLSDPTLHITIGVEASGDGGLTWRSLASLNWDGGHLDKTTGTWGLPYIHNIKPDDESGQSIAGQLVRAYADLPRSVNFGGTVTIRG